MHTSKSNRRKKKEQELQSDRAIERILRDDGMKKPKVVHVVEGDFTNLLSKKEISEGKTLGPGNSIIIDTATNSTYKLR